MLDTKSYWRYRVTLPFSHQRSRTEDHWDWLSQLHSKRLDLHKQDHSPENNFIENNSSCERFNVHDIVSNFHPGRHYKAILCLETAVLIVQLLFQYIKISLKSVLTKCIYNAVSCLCRMACITYVDHKSTLSFIHVLSVTDYSLCVFQFVSAVIQSLIKLTDLIKQINSNVKTVV